MLFGMSHPFGFVRSALEDAFRSQVPDTNLESIVTYDTPKFQFLCRQVDDEGNATVSHFGFSVRARLQLSSAGENRKETAESVLTFFFRDIDIPGQLKHRKYVDLGDDAAVSFNDELFLNRFIAFRSEISPLDDVAKYEEKRNQRPWWKLW